MSDGTGSQGQPAVTAKLPVNKNDLINGVLDDDLRLSVKGGLSVGIALQIQDVRLAKQTLHTIASWGNEIQIELHAGKNLSGGDAV